jgi:hypothetical protein
MEKQETKHQRTSFIHPIIAPDGKTYEFTDYVEQHIPGVLRKPKIIQPIIGRDGKSYDLWEYITLFPREVYAPGWKGDKEEYSRLVTLYGRETLKIWYEEKAESYRKETIQAMEAGNFSFVLPRYKFLLEKQYPMPYEDIYKLLDLVRRLGSPYLFPKVLKYLLEMEETPLKTQVVKILTDGIEFSSFFTKSKVEGYAKPEKEW